MMPRKKTNPAHHNAGRLPNFNQDLTRHLSFANFNLKGLSGNLSSAERLLSGDMRHKDYAKLPPEDVLMILDICKRLRILVSELRDFSEDIAEFNRDKTKLKLPPTKKLPMRGG